MPYACPVFEWGRRFLLYCDNPNAVDGVPMQPFELKKDIYWVGAVDFDIRNFHHVHIRR